MTNSNFQKFNEESLSHVEQLNTYHERLDVTNTIFGTRSSSVCVRPALSRGGLKEEHGCVRQWHGEHGEHGEHRRTASEMPQR